MMADNYKEQLIKWCCRDLAKPRSRSINTVQAMQYYFRPVILEGLPEVTPLLVYCQVDVALS